MASLSVSMAGLVPPHSYRGMTALPFHSASTGWCSEDPEILAVLPFGYFATGRPLRGAPRVEPRSLAFLQLHQAGFERRPEQFVGAAALAESVHRLAQRPRQRRIGGPVGRRIGDQPLQARVQLGGDGQVGVRARLPDPVLDMRRAVAD